jgi:hypothetical protein
MYVCIVVTKDVIKVMSIKGVGEEKEKTQNTKSRWTRPSARIVVIPIVIPYYSK